MQVGIIHPYFDVTGGAEITTLSLIDTLITNKIKTDLYCVIPPTRSDSEFLNIIKIKHKKFPLFWKYQRMLEIKELFDKVANNDILFVMSGGLTLENSNVKTTYLYCHSTFNNEINFIKTGFSGIKSVYYKIIKNKIKKSLELLKKNEIKLISNSNYTKNEIKRNFNKSSVVIYPPVDIDYYKKFQTKNKLKKIVAVSRFSPEKNLEFMNKVFHKISFQCELFGNAKHKNQLKILADLENKKSKNVKIYPNISSEKIADKLSDSKVYFHSSEETFGISVVEAIAAGCVPIVPDNSAHRETVPFSDLRYKENDIQEAIKKINAAMNGDFDNIHEKLLKYIEEFSVKKFQKRTLEFLK